MTKYLGRLFRAGAAAAHTCYPTSFAINFLVIKEKGATFESKFGEKINIKRRLKELSHDYRLLGCHA